MDYMNLDFKLPEMKGKRSWYRYADTSLPSPEDIVQKGKEVKIDEPHYTANAHSVVILISK